MGGGHASVYAHGVRRAAILLAGIRPAAGLLDALASRRIPRIPHLGGQPGPGAAGAAGRVAANGASDDRRARGESLSPQSLSVWRAAVRTRRDLPRVWGGG